MKLLEPSDELVICEGEFDCIITEQEGFHSVGIPGVTNIPKDQIHLLMRYKLFLAFDNDEAGEIALQKFARLVNQPIKIIKLKQNKDLTELLNEKNG